MTRDPFTIFQLTSTTTHIGDYQWDVLHSFSHNDLNTVSTTTPLSSYEPHPSCSTVTHSHNTGQWQSNRHDTALEECPKPAERHGGMELKSRPGVDNHTTKTLIKKHESQTCIHGAVWSWGVVRRQDVRQQTGLGKPLGTRWQTANQPRHSSSRLNLADSSLDFIVDQLFLKCYFIDV